MIEICTVGGYEDIGGNMTAVKYGDEVIIFDMGLMLEKFINYKGDENIEELSTDQMIKIGALPNDNHIESWKPLVKAIVPTHAHLDHVGAIPFMSNHYDAPIIATPYTAQIIESLAENYHRELNNRVVRLNSGGTYKISDNLTVEFVSMSHSIMQTISVALHTPEGVVIYANDFKLDDTPPNGAKPNYKRFEELSEEGIKCILLDSTYATLDAKTPSESVAKDMLKDVLLDESNKGKGMIVTTFSSHLSRLKTIIECGKKMKRKIVFLGRSLSRYIEAGEAIGIIKFTNDIELVKYGKQIRRKLKEIEHKKEKYLLVVTGHQGEPEATLSKMANGTYSYNFDEDDRVVFSCTVIPSPINEENRDRLEAELEKFGVKMFMDIHVSGHGAQQDHRRFLSLTKPEHLIPSHGNITMRTALANIAKEEGLNEENIHMMENGDHQVLY